MAMISHLSGRPRLFPRLSQLGHTSPFRLSSRQSTPVLLQVSDPQSLNLNTLTPLAMEGMQAASWLGSAVQQLSLW